MRTEDLHQLGFPTDLLAELDEAERARLARVSADFGIHAEVLTPTALRADIPHTLRRREGVVVGDWVILGEGELPPIQRVLPRRGVIVRHAAGRRSVPQRLAAHLDTVFVVTTPNQEFNAARLERYATMVRDADVELVFVLNKCDLVDDPAPWIDALDELTHEDERVLATSAHEADIPKHFAPWLSTGRTLAFIGSSGTGKSTLINRLLGEERMRTGDIRDRDDEGRHTTTHRQLLPLPGGALLLDTPGMREVEPWRELPAHTRHQRRRNQNRRD